MENTDYRDYRDPRHEITVTLNFDVSQDIVSAIDKATIYIHEQFPGKMFKSVSAYIDQHGKYFSGIFVEG